MNENIKKCLAKKKRGDPTTLSREELLAKARQQGLRVLSTATKKQLCDIMHGTPRPGTMLTRPVAKQKPQAQPLTEKQICLAKKKRGDPTTLSREELLAKARQQGLRVLSTATKKELCDILHGTPRPGAMLTRPETAPAAPLDAASKNAFFRTFDPSKCTNKKKKADQSTYTKEELYKIATGLDLPVTKYTSKYFLCTKLQLYKDRQQQARVGSEERVIVDKLKSAVSGRQYAYNAAHPLYKHDPYIVDIVMNAQNRRISRDQQKYLNLPGKGAFINGIMQNYQNYVVQQTFNQYVPVTQGLPKLKNWKPKLGPLERVKNFVCPISLEIPEPEDAVYLRVDVTNGNVISQLYDVNYLKQALYDRAESPLTKKPVKWDDVLKYNTRNQVLLDVYKSVILEHRAVVSIDTLQAIHKTQILSRLKKYLENIRFKANNMEADRNVPVCHAHNNRSMTTVRGGCMQRVELLFEYIMSLPAGAKRVDALKRLDRLKPVCVEAICNEIQEFMAENSGNAAMFEFDSKANKSTNISNATQVLVKNACKEYQSVKRIRDELFSSLYSKTWSRVGRKMASDGTIELEDVIDFFLDFAEYITCDHVELNGIDILVPKIKLYQSAARNVDEIAKKVQKIDYVPGRYVEFDQIWT